MVPVAWRRFDQHIFQTEGANLGGPEAPGKFRRRDLTDMTEREGITNYVRVSDSIPILPTCSTQLHRGLRHRPFTTQPGFESR
jgi:hypothetical protein